MNNKRRCPNCKRYNLLHDWGVLLINKRLYCDIDCAMDYAKKNNEKIKEKQRKAKRSEYLKTKRNYRENNKSHQIRLTQKSFNAFIRELDKNEPCASCFKPANSFVVTAGHFLTTASTPELRFDPRNAYAQCSGCNTGQQKYYKGDRASIRQNFEQTILSRYGQKMLDYLKSPHPLPDYSIDQLKELRHTFSTEKNRLQKGELPSKNWRVLPNDKCTVKLS